MSNQLARDELVALVSRITDAAATEEEIDRCLELLSANVPHPSVSDLIFHPSGAALSADQVVELAMAYKPISLGHAGSTYS